MDEKLEYKLVRMAAYEINSPKPTAGGSLTAGDLLAVTDIVRDIPNLERKMDMIFQVLRYATAKGYRAGLREGRKCKPA